MNITTALRSVRAAAKLASTALLVFAHTAVPALLAEPLAFRDGGGIGRPAPQNAHFALRVEQAVDLVRSQARLAPACRAYFERLGVDLEVWLAPDTPPYVIPRRLDSHSWRNTEPVCGGAQGQPPFEFLFIDKGCFRGPDVCDLASLLLHEIGHLARRDSRDNEPPEFFAACRLSACVDPARYY